MATNHGHGHNPHENGAGNNLSVEYDRSDLSAKGILIFLVVLGVFAIAMHLGTLALYAGMTKIAERQEPETSPLAPQTYTPRDGILTNTANVNTQQFPEPRLQRHMSEKEESSHALGEPGEMTKFLLEETASLNARPWQDDQGHVHLPIDQAMNAVLPRLPVRAGGAQIPNYPGAAREYAYPTAADVAETEPNATQPNAGEPKPNPSGEAGASSAGK